MLFNKPESFMSFSHKIFDLGAFSNGCNNIAEDLNKSSIEGGESMKAMDLMDICRCRTLQHSDDFSGIYRNALA